MNLDTSPQQLRQLIRRPQMDHPHIRYRTRLSKGQPVMLPAEETFNFLLFYDVFWDTLYSSYSTD